MADRHLVLIKIGGSLITKKNQAFTLNRKALKLIAQEISKIFVLKNKYLLIGHGAGSFAHIPAQKYQTISGIKKKADLLGMAKVCEAACCLNRIVVAEFLKIGLPAVSWSPFSTFLSENFKLKRLFHWSLKKLLLMGLLPVAYGDVIVDNKKGCTIFSTEKILNSIGRYLQKDGFRIEKIIHYGKTPGVCDQKGRVIPIINRKNFGFYKNILGGPKGIDVTGGMLHKIEVGLQMAKKGIPCLIIGGNKKDILSKAILGKKVLGTRIE